MVFALYEETQKKVYDVPLTARTTVPAEWTPAQVTQGRNTTKATVEKGAGGSSSSIT